MLNTKFKLVGRDVCSSLVAHLAAVAAARVRISASCQLPNIVQKVKTSIAEPPGAANFEVAPEPIFCRSEPRTGAAVLWRLRLLLDLLKKIVLILTSMLLYMRLAKVTRGRLRSQKSCKVP